MTDALKPLRDALEDEPCAIVIDVNTRLDAMRAYRDWCTELAQIATPEMLNTLLARLDAAEAALSDAATSLETIGRLAGKEHYADGLLTCMGTFSEVRGYAISRAQAAHPAPSPAVAVPDVRNELRELAEAFSAMYPADTQGIAAQGRWATRRDAALKNAFAALATQQAQTKGGAA